MQNLSIKRPILQNTFHFSVMFYIFAFLTCCLSTFNATAQLLVVKDCQGLTRAAKSVDPGSINKIEINVSEVSGDVTNPTQLEMTNAVTGEVQVAQVQNGVAVFEQVPAGTFSLSAAGDVSVASVTVGTTATGGVVAATGAGLAVGGAAAGGAVVAGTEINNSITEDTNEDTNGGGDGDNGSGNGNATPTPGGSETAEPTPTPVPTPAPPTEPTPTPEPEDCNCDPDAEPTPLDDFFSDAKKPLNKDEKVKKERLTRQPLSPYK